jgi:hypothetical protein
VREGKARWHFDLRGYVSAQLVQCGVQNFKYVGGDTFLDHERYHSYRRATGRGDPEYGRQISVIALP